MTVLLMKYNRLKETENNASAKIRKQLVFLHRLIEKALQARQ